jgi:hypothetical protein
MLLKPTPALSVSTAGNGDTPPRPATHRPHAVHGALVLTLRPTIAHSLVAAGETPLLCHLSQLHQREPHALMRHIVLTVKVSTVRPTDNAHFGIISLIGIGSALGLGWSMRGQRHLKLLWQRRVHGSARGDLCLTDDAPRPGLNTPALPIGGCHLLWVKQLVGDFGFNRLLSSTINVVIFPFSRITSSTTPPSPNRLIH